MNLTMREGNLLSVNANFALPKEDKRSVATRICCNTLEVL